MRQRRYARRHHSWEHQMNRKNLAIFMCAAPLGAIGLGQAAVAQEEDDSVFDTVIVTAQKREQSIYDVPVAISAFTPETLERQGITDLTDIGKFVPNLNVTGFSAGHTSSQNPFIRGIGLQDHRSRPSRAWVSTWMASISAARSARTGVSPISSAWK